ncbi:Fructosamine/Ketosamine-3-kinase [Hypoxylon rubiginosum]|uniref:Fructosamine/Ketosamine-3-kinase n=1 Tax=Hypoxylon rubiginosum TaxID=110542 RepID=A0ACB9YYY7_9PEZI|nr:Fructosamine/Ketosamine-3-kinase [Hypoxylon rubiginosum]
MMLAGEYTSLSTIQKVCPGLVPNLLGFGRYRNNPPGLIMYFLVEEFLTIDKAVPDPMKMASQLAKMHREGASPTGKFGFPVTTCDGPLPHPVDWKDTWAAFFAELLRSRVRMDANACGEWQKLELAAEQVITKVVPRLLVPLKWEGRPIEPSLIHGDLWDANVSTLESGEPIIYDAGSYYAHNEMEIGIWRVIYAKNLGDLAYKDAYFRSYPPAEPVEELDDRNRLYSLKCNLNWSATDPGIITRRIAYNDMCYLCEKYAPLEDLDSYDPELDPTVTRHIAVTS